MTKLFISSISASCYQCHITTVITIHHPSIMVKTWLDPASKEPMPTSRRKCQTSNADADNNKRAKIDNEHESNNKQKDRKGAKKRERTTVSACTHTKQLI